MGDTLTPVPLAEAENESPGANTDILDSDVSPTVDGARLAVRITVGGATALNVMEDVGATGSNVRTHNLNDGGDLTANVMHEFAVTARSANAYNFQIAADETVVVMEVIELPSGVPI